MALATVEQVIAELDGDESVDHDYIQDLIDTVTEFVNEVWGGGWDVTPGTVVVKKFFNAYSDALLVLPDPQPTITKVQVFPRGIPLEDSIFTIGESSWQLTDNGRFQFLISNLVSVPGVDFISQRTMRSIFREVDITYIASGIIPKPVTRAVAMIAAANYAQRDLNIRGMSSEHIGGYSYTRDPWNSGLIVPPIARSWLRPYGSKLRARVV